MSKLRPRTIDFCSLVLLSFCVAFSVPQLVAAQAADPEPAGVPREADWIRGTGEEIEILIRGTIVDAKGNSRVELELQSRKKKSSDS
jgi:hypothetical protein